MKLLASYYRIFIIFAFYIPTSVFASWHKAEFNVMGTKAHYLFWLEASDTAAQLEQNIVNELHRIDLLMSSYKTTSELSQLNKYAFNAPYAISTELYELIKTALIVSKESDGAFDITYASVGYQYDFRNKVKPSGKDIEFNIEGLNYKNIRLLADHKIQFTHPNTKIALGGIAKGHAIKNALGILKTAGIKHAMIGAGGDTVVLGDKMGQGWQVGIKHPRAKDKSAAIIPLINEAISTSGDYERFFIKDGVRYHHIINPKTGDSAREVVSVSVIGADPTLTDAYSTAIFVKGLKLGLAFINSTADYEAIIIDNKQTLHFSEGLLSQ